MTCILCFMLLFYSIPHILCFLSGQKLLRLFSSKVYCLCLTACVCCILALWAVSTSLLSCVLYSKNCFFLSPLCLPAFLLYSSVTSWISEITFKKKKKKARSAVHSAEAASQTYLCSFSLKFKSGSHTSWFQRNVIVQAQRGLVLAPSVLSHSCCNRSEVVAAATASSSFLPSSSESLPLCLLGFSTWRFLQSQQSLNRLKQTTPAPC